MSSLTTLLQRLHTDEPVDGFDFPAAWDQEASGLTLSRVVMLAGRGHEIASEPGLMMNPRRLRARIEAPTLSQLTAIARRVHSIRSARSETLSDFIDACSWVRFLDADDPVAAAWANDPSPDNLVTVLQLLGHSTGDPVFEEAMRITLVDSRMDRERWRLSASKEIRTLRPAPTITDLRDSENRGFVSRFLLAAADRLSDTGELE